MLTVALFIIAKCPSTDDEMSYIQTMEYYWAIIRNRVLIQSAQMKSENTMLSKESQSPQDYILPDPTHMEYSE